MKSFNYKFANHREASFNRQMYDIWMELLDRGFSMSLKHQRILSQMTDNYNQAKKWNRIVNGKRLQKNFRSGLTKDDTRV